MKKLFIFFAIITIVLSACSGEDENSSTVKNSGNEKEVASEQRNGPKEIAGELGKAYDLTVYKGNSAEIDEKIKITLSNPHVEPALSSTDSLNEKYDYLVIDVAIENIGDTETQSNRVDYTASITAYNENGVEITTLGGETKSDKYAMFQTGSLRPGGKNEGTLIKWIKEGETPYEIAFESDLWGYGDTLMVKMD